ncbi:MAG TPA: class I SAM-dependent methyltransferase [Gammaproteobacteria bacterium]|nr:class I SAM-dependent methyltransferase [Gammaproteobacteria bacterium]
MTSIPDIEALKTRLKSMWMAGDYGHFAQYLEPGALRFMDSLGIRSGDRVLDVACGAGQLTLPIARLGAQVVGVDIASNLVEQARKRAQAAGLEADFEEGDAEALRFDDASFDVVFSLIGAMFAPRPERVAAEMMRVCRRTGRLAMGNWTPAGFIGQMFKITASHVAPPVGMPSPVLWGDEDSVRQRFGDGVRDLSMTRRMYSIRYPFAPPAVVEFFRSYYGPTNRAFGALDEAGQAALRGDLEALWQQHNAATDGSTAIEAEYLEILATRT